MVLYPAIDIKDGKCVRLVMGRENEKTVYGDDPAAMAASFERAGARALHVVDLDGAFSGGAKNLPAVKRILEAVTIPVQLGGGIRTMDAIDERLGMGVDRVILGTAALYDMELVERAAKKYPGRVLAGIDALNGRVAVKGWVEVTDETPVAFAKKLKALGVTAAVYTDISRDGTLKGPSLDSTLEMVEQSGLDIIASGGVGAADDLIKLKALGVSGVIIGKAIYDGRIDLQEALKAFTERGN